MVHTELHRLVHARVLLLFWKLFCHRLCNSVLRVSLFDPVYYEIDLQYSDRPLPRISMHATKLTINNSANCEVQ